MSNPKQMSGGSTGPNGANAVSAMVATAATNGHVWGAPTPGMAALLEGNVPSVWGAGTAVSSTASTIPGQSASSAGSGAPPAATSLNSARRRETAHGKAADKKHATADGAVTQRGQAMLEELQDDLNIMVADSQRAIARATHARFETLMQRYDEGVQRRLSSIESGMQALRDSDTQRGQQTQEVRSDIQAVRTAQSQQAGLANRPNNNANGQFNRDADQTILRINTASLTPKASVISVLTNVCNAAGMDPNVCKVLAADNAISRTWTLQMDGDRHTAATRVKHLISSLLGAGGVWQQLSTTSTTTTFLSNIYRRFSTASINTQLWHLQAISDMSFSCKVTLTSSLQRKLHSFWHVLYIKYNITHIIRP
eukprot:TRINITY_DN53527_c0_g1_i1.p1 TRINITY_DN53527_c0_g1~~TRINITY_DN53527_c0_g1_i1.p1  ORF type:complete len:368 (-),score=63.96 TRINITY_DN53527_c0_g1_i1:372-1475(-)